MISVHFQGKPFSITVTQVYAPITDVKEAEADQFYEDLQHFLELTEKRSFSSQGTGRQKQEVRESWSNRQALVAQMVKSPPAVRETQVQSPGREDPLEKEIVTQPVFLPGESHGWRSLAIHGIAKSWT